MTTLSATDLDRVTGGVDFGPAKRILSRGVEDGASGAVVGGTSGAVIGGVTGAFGGPATILPGMGIGLGVGAAMGAVGGFATGVASQARQEFGGGGRR